MRIDLNPGLPLAEADANRTRSSRPLSKSNDDTAVGPELAAASSSTSVRSLAKSALSAPEVRMEKVEALRSEAASGRYEVSSQQIAGSMIEQLLARH